MFMQKIDLPRVTCDLFGVKSGFYGSGNGSSITGDKPRAATEDEARAYADFIRRKNGLPEIGKPQLHHTGYCRGQAPGQHFHYRGATFGQHLGGGEYEPGAFSVLFPGANTMRATVTMETLDDAGEVVSSQTMPIEPKKGGVVWSKDDVRKAAGPVAKHGKAKRTPTVVKRRAAPTVDKRRRAILLALKLRAELRRMRAEARQTPKDCATPVSAPYAPATAPDAILGDLAAAEALMRGEGYVAPAVPRLRAGMRIVLHCASYRGLRATAYHKGTGVGWAAVTDCGRHLTIYPDASDVWSPCPTVDEATPTSGQTKRTPAHERAIRRAWSERKARRLANVHLRIGTAQYEHVKADLERVKALEACTRSLASEMSEESAKRIRAVEDRARLAEQEAAEALAMREDLKRILADAEARLADAEAENAQLWAEIETLTAPQPALAA